MSIWIEILLAEERDEFDVEDWKHLREIAKELCQFQSTLNETTASKNQRLLKILGYESIYDIKKEQKQFRQDISLIVDVQVSCKQHGINVENFCNDIGFIAANGKTAKGPSLRAKYYKALGRLNIAPEDAAELVELVGGHSAP